MIRPSPMSTDLQAEPPYTDKVISLEQSYQLDPSDVNFRSLHEAKSSLFKLQEQEEIYWKQKAASKHLIDGDKNTKYYHALVKKNRAKNFIQKICISKGIYTEDAGEISKSVVDHFTNIFNKSFEPSAIEHFDIIPQIINLEDNIALSIPPFMEEVKQTVFSRNIDSIAVKSQYKMMN
ncbi:hypothetical protein M5K25_008353 [Dendrobium thyrsiflorum]|uniref:Uncharacterized protein n=1 Tax=Dendrobium thyrsiflorum TaxID=117978 RepID=A0ABD0V8H9_DENTH